MCVLLVASLICLLCSAWWPTTLGLLAIPGVLLLFGKPLRSPRSMIYWSVGLIAGHVWWVAVLAYQHMSAPILRAILLYFLCVVWLSLIATCFWLLVRPFSRWLVAQPLVLIGFFYLMANGSLPFLSGIKGYPFFNPVLPIVAWWQPGQTLEPFKWCAVSDGYKELEVCYVQPPAPRKQTRAGRSQQIYKALNRVPAIARSLSRSDLRIIVSPESLFSYEITEEAELSLWQSILPQGVYFLFGGVRANGKKRLQTAFLLSKFPITHCFDKKKCLDFFECFDDSNVFHRILNDLMDWKTDIIEPCTSRQSSSCEVQGVRIRPLLCADVMIEKSGTDMPIVLINESWFLPWVQDLWWAACVWHCRGRVAIIVGHDRAIACGVRFLAG